MGDVRGVIGAVDLKPSLLVAVSQRQQVKWWCVSRAAFRRATGLFAARNATPGASGASSQARRGPSSPQNARVVFDVVLSDFFDF